MRDTVRRVVNPEPIGPGRTYRVKLRDGLDHFTLGDVVRSAAIFLAIFAGFLFGIFVAVSWFLSTVGAAADRIGARDSVEPAEPVSCEEGDHIQMRVDEFGTWWIVCNPRESI